MQPLLIGVGLSASAAPEADPVAAALAAERAGYDFVSVSDHPVGTNPSYETTTLLTWIAARTSRIRIASRVLATPFRRPAMVAKLAESLDRLSGGRLILGLGGGYSDAEIHALGGPVPSPRAKVDGMAEAIQITRAAWAEPSVDYHGAIHRVNALSLEPKPQHPIPIWLGTYGNRALAATGRLADGWIPSLGSLTPQQVPEMLDRIRTAATAAGREAEVVRAVLNVAIHLDPHRHSGEDVVAGSAADVVEQLHALTELGFTGFNLMPGSQAQPIAEEVLPGLRAISDRT